VAGRPQSDWWPNLVAATFGNVHGVYKPRHVKLKPGVLKDCRDAVVEAHGEGVRIYLVFHGGSGSALSEIHETLDYGVVKMNVDRQSGTLDRLLWPCRV
jgi:fructose-bisphosphate aldolase class II